MMDIAQRPEAWVKKPCRQLEPRLPRPGTRRNPLVLSVLGPLPSGKARSAPQVLARSNASHDLAKLSKSSHPSATADRMVPSAECSVSRP